MVAALRPVRQAVRRAARLPLLRPAARRLSPVVNHARRAWRRSLQLRMVTITVLSSGLLVGGFGYLVAQRSTNALLDGARNDARSQLLAGVTYAEEQLGTWPNAEDPGTTDRANVLLSTLAGRREQGGGIIATMRFAKEPASSLPTAGLTWPQQFRGMNAAISPELAESVAGKGMIASQIRVVDLGGDRPGARTYLIYGAPVPATKFKSGSVELYYAFPLDTEAAVAEDFSNTVTYIGAGLVLLLVVLVVLVTRLVVNPVRLAARTAQRLSAGLLDQRMVVNGEDELALLAGAFNQMAESLQRQIVRLEEMSRLQRRFTSDVSHELRTPLTTIRMAADLLHSERDSFDPAAARSAELLQTELDRFEELLSDLLEISRFDAGFAMLDAEPTDLVTVVRRVAERLEPLATRVGVPLEVVAPDPPIIAEVDPRRVERILRNLVGNAVDHGEGQPVVVTLAVDRHAIAITVRDRGIGLTKDEEKLVFNRFWRADPSRARQTGGTGLGLSISLEDARLHGGRLEAWGEPGRGAQFRLTLPVRSGGRVTESPLPLIPVDEVAVIRPVPPVEVTA